MLRLGCLQWVLMGTPEEIEEDTEKSFWGLTRYAESLWNKVLQIPKRTVFPFYSPAGSILPWKPTPTPLAGWLLEAKATALPEQLFAAANLARLRRS